MRRVFVLILLLVSGCASPMQAQFDEEPLKVILESGTGKIAGSAFTKTRSGEIRTPWEVILMPCSPYTDEVCRRGALIPEQGWKPVIDGRMFLYIRRAPCDADGRFEFDSVPDGDYLLTCGIYWEAFNASLGGGQVVGLNLTERIRVGPDSRERAAKVMLRPR